ncbi:hypothetical protein ACFE04_007794 [Oxalis oulophora]
MDTNNNQDHHLTTQSSGDQESNHGVGGGTHLCHRCGWPFPNPHPSAKHKRAHRRHCGTIQGYTILVHSLGHQSDDDPKTPSPKPVQKSLSKTWSAGTGSMSNRSEDEVFSDTLTEFQESGGINHGIEGHLDEAATPTTNLEEDNKSNGKSTDQMKDNIATDISNPAADSTVSTESQIPEVQKSKAEHEKCEFSTVDVTVFPIDSSSFPPEVSNEKLKDQSKVQKIRLDDELAEKSIGQKSEDVSPDRNVIEELENFHVFYIPEPSGDFLVEKYAKRLQGFKGHKEVNLVAPQTLDLGENVTEENYSSSPARQPDSIVIEEQKRENLYAFSLPKPSGDVYEENYFSCPTSQLDSNVTEGLENFHVLSLPEPSDNFHVVENAETVLRGFKDHKGVILEVPQTLDLGENVETKEDGSNDSGSKEKHTSSPARQLEENTEICVSERHFFEDTRNSGNELEVQIDSVKGEDNKDVVEKAHFETESHLPQIAPLSDEGSNESKAPVSSLEYEDGKTKHVIEKVRVEGELNISETEKLVVNEELVEEEYNIIDTRIPDIEEPRKEEIIVKQADGPPFELRNEEVSIEKEDVLEMKVSNNAGQNENEMPADKIEYEDDKPVVKDLTLGKEGGMFSTEVKNDKDPDKILTDALTIDMGNKEQQLPVVFDSDRSSQMIPSETATDILPDNDMNLEDTALDQKTVLLVSNSAGNQESTTEQFDLAGNDEKIVEEKNIAESNVVTSESANYLAESQTESEHAHIDRVAETRAVNVSGECVNEAHLAAELSHNEFRELSAKSVEDEKQLESSATLENNQGAALLGTSVVDASLDSSSQTDSLEGNWGSVSVLSMHSDTTAFLDGEERNNSQKPKGTPDSLRSDKSDDLFEAPSIMTSIKTGESNDEKATEIQTLESSQEQTTSHERMKNEQIIAKVTNWSTTESGKQQHMPLKSLLVEAKPKPKEKQSLLAKMDENDDGAKVGSKPGAEEAVTVSAKEWNSPARYPADIKREKRKAKPYWAQFVCCSSEN